MPFDDYADELEMDPQAEEVADPAPTAPQAPVVAQPNPEDGAAQQAPRQYNDPIAAYLRRKLGHDQELASAQTQENWMNVAKGLAGVGDAFVRGRQNEANRLNGRGPETGPGMGAQAIAALPSPVQQYIQRRTQDRADSAEAASDARAQAFLIKAQASNGAADPNSLAAMKLKATNDRIALQSKDLDRKNRQGDANLDETKHWHEVEADLRNKGLSEQQIKDRISKEKLGIQQQRLGLANEKLENDEGAGTVATAQSQDRYLKPAAAENLNDRIQSARTVQGTLDDIKDILAKHRAGAMVPSDAQARLQARFAELGPQWNNAQTKLAFSGPRGQAIAHAITDPTSAAGVIKDLMTGGDYSKSNLGEIEKIIDESVRNQASSRGVTLGKKVGEKPEGGPRVKSAKPGRPGSGTARGEMSPEDQAALDWADKNPKDPRAAAVRKRLGVQ